MSDKYNGFIVTFESSIKDEEAENLKKALLYFKGIIKVEPIVDNFESQCIRRQVYMDVAKKILSALEL